jgi:hypothetical protein
MRPYFLFVRGSEGSLKGEEEMNPSSPPLLFGVT